MSEDVKQDPPCVRWMMTRRRFLEGAAMAVAMAPVLSGCEFADAEPIDAEDFEFDLSQPGFEKLMTVGGIFAGKAGSVDFLLVRADDTTIMAFDRFCPHVNLDMSQEDNNPLKGTWDAAKKQLTCGWHQSVFDEDGKVVSGPATTGINRYTVEYDAAAMKGFVKFRGAA